RDSDAVRRQRACGVQRDLRRTARRDGGREDDEEGEAQHAATVSRPPPAGLSDSCYTRVRDPATTHAMPAAIDARPTIGESGMSCCLSAVAFTGPMSTTVSRVV